MIENWFPKVSKISQTHAPAKDNFVTPVDKTNLSQPPAVGDIMDRDLNSVLADHAPSEGSVTPSRRNSDQVDSAIKSINHTVTKKLNFSPLEADSPATSTIKTEELSSFYISPVTATNDGFSVRSSLSDFVPQGSLFSALGSTLNRTGTDISSPDMIANVTIPSDNEDLSETGNEAETAMDVDDDNYIQEEQLQYNEKGRPVRKRKPTDFFDGDKVQPKKPRAPRAKKSSDSTSSTKEAKASEQKVKLSVEEELAIAFAEDGEEPLDGRDAEEYNPDQEKGKKKRGTKRGPRKSASTSGLDGNAEENLCSENLQLAPEPVVLPAEIQLKISKFSDRIVELTAELINLEKHTDFIDMNLDLDELTEELDRFLSKPVGVDFLSEVIDFKRLSAMKQSATAAATAQKDSAEQRPESTERAVDEPITDIPAEEAFDLPVSPVRAVPSNPPNVDLAIAVVEEELAMNDQALAQACFGYIRSVIIRCMQGHSCGLSSLVEPVIEKLTSMVQYLQNLSEDKTNDVEIVRVRDALLQQMQSLGDSVALETELKLCAERVAYGIRSKQDIFDNLDQECIWRWEVHALPSFRDSSQKLVKEVRALRNRYSRAIKAASSLIQHLRKKFDDNVKTVAFEEKVVKAMAEIEKFKEKRRELEAKRLSDLEEKSKREEAKEKKRKEKEESEMLKKQQQEEAVAAKAALKAAAQAEKDRKKAEDDARKAEELAKKNEEEAKKQQKIQKQKSFFTSFFKPGSSTAPSAPASSSVCTPNTENATADVFNAASASDPVAPIAPKTTKTTDKVVDIAAEDERHRQFIETLNSRMSISDIQRSYVERYNAKLTVGKQVASEKRSHPKHITVPVEIAKLSTSTANAAAFGEDNTFIEIEHRTFRNRVNTYSFYEDNRPAYVGTWSKRSRVISGRRPFEQDHEQLRYDYDSEEEWEEEGEGEDIAMSDGSRDEEDDEEGGNELEYDDFFRHDNDFGSDIESDDEGIVCTSLPMALGKIKEECVGPRFLVNSAWQGINTAVAAEGYLTLDRSRVTNVCQFNLGSQRMMTCGMVDDESQKLSQYTSVVFTPANMRLVTTTAAPSNNMTSSSSASTPKEPGTSSASKKKSKELEASKAVVKEDLVATAAMNATNTGVKFIKGFDESKLLDLVQLMHGSKDGVDKLVNSFVEQNAHISKAQIRKRMVEIAEKKKHADGYGSQRWVVNDEIFASLKATVPSFVEKPLEYTPVKAIPVSSGSSKKRIVPSVVTAFANVSPISAIPEKLEEGKIESTLKKPEIASISSPIAATPAKPVTVASGSTKKRITPSVVTAFSNVSSTIAAEKTIEKSTDAPKSSSTQDNIVNLLE